MGGKGSAPPPPDYVGAAREQAAASAELTNMQNYANRPTVNTPFGGQNWSTQVTTDPATGQKVTQWTQNTFLDPDLQSALDSQIGLQNQRSQLAGSFMGRVGQEYAQPFNWSNLPQMGQLSGPGTLQTSTGNYSGQLANWINSRSGETTGGFFSVDPQMRVDPMTNNLARGTNTQSVQRSLSTGDNPALPQFDSSYRDTVARTLMERMQPVHERQQNQLETQLANQGFTVGSEGYTRALADLQQRQAAERFNALDTAGNEAQRLFQMGMGARQQAFNEDVTGGQFFNQAANQAFSQNLAADQFRNQATQQAFNQAMGAGQFGNQAQQQLYNQRMGQANLMNQAAAQRFQQDLAAQQFRNQALGQASALDLANMQARNQALQQQFGMNQQFAEAQNRLRQQAIAEQMQRRGMSLNEMNALLTGQQVGMPQMPTFATANRSEAPNLVGALGAQYDAQLGAYNAQQAGANNMLGGLFQLGGAAMPFMFSDKRLKRNIKRIGTHPIGVGIYEYTMLGYPQVGVIAQEVQKVRPDLVERHANGYLMVNYGGL